MTKFDFKVSVFRGYEGSSRVLVNSRGQVWRARCGWDAPEQSVTTVGEAYESWSDVPFAWIGGCPFWR